MINNGRYTSSEFGNNKFPANGYRGSNGGLSSPSITGGFWSSTMGIYTDTSLSLYFDYYPDSALLYPQYNDERAMGFAVRCIRDN